MHYFAKALLPVLSSLLAACQPERNAPARPAAGQCLSEPVFQAPPLNACSGSRHVRLTIVGDVLLHRPLQQLGYRRGFAGIWAQAAPYLGAADIAIANLEGPVAPGITRSGRRQSDPGPVFDGVVYTGYPAFNYHASVLGALRAAGIDLVTTANNHAMDRGPVGEDLTLAQLELAGIGAVGTIRTGAPRNFTYHQETAVGRLAFIACSFSTNGLPDPNRQMLRCYRDRAELLTLVRREAADPDVAGVVVLPHWGREYSSAPDAHQVELARDLAAAGASAIVGTHPHAVQPFGLLNGAGGATVPVIYSTGNFVAGQSSMPARVGALALLDLCRGKNRQRLVAERVGWIAGQMRFSGQGYWLDIAPARSEGARGVAYRHLSRIAPGFSAQPEACAQP